MRGARAREVRESQFIGQGKFIRQKHVPGHSPERLQQRASFRRRTWSPRVGGVAEDADEAVLRQRAAGPALRLDGAKPKARGIVELVGGIAEGHEHANVKQVHRSERQFLAEAVHHLPRDLPRTPAPGPAEDREPVPASLGHRGFRGPQHSGGGIPGDLARDVPQSLDHQLPQGGVTLGRQHLDAAEQRVGKLDGGLHPYINMGVRADVKGMAGGETKSGAELPDLGLQRGDIQSPGGASASVRLNGVLHRA